MKFETPTIQKPEEVAPETPAESSEEERQYSPEERRIIIEDARKNLREGAARYHEQQKRIEEAFDKLLK